MQLSRDFRELIDCSISRDVRFLIVGGDAVAAHGHPRMTKDLDVWILADATHPRQPRTARLRKRQPPDFSHEFPC